jgi:FdhD protein
MKSGKHPVRYYRYHSGTWDSVDSATIVESPVSLTVNGEVWLSFMCTPTDLEALAVGFLFNERIINTIAEIADVRVCEHGDNIDVWLTHAAEKPREWRRTSGCTGGVTAVSTELKPSFPLNGFTISPQEIHRLVESLFESQDLYRQVGGVHTSALSDGQTILVTAEDIGRHNSVEKLAGLCLLNQIDIPKYILITTGRISSEMLQKAARIGAAVVISRTSPSSLSIQMAETLGITLIGYARRSQFNVYAHPGRILTAQNMEMDKVIELDRSSLSNQPTDKITKNLV